MTGPGSWSWETSRDRNGTCCAISGNNFFADPFPIAWRGKTYLFFEDLDHRIGKGIISVQEFGPDGRSAKPFLSSKSPGIFPIPF